MYTFFLIKSACYQQIIGIFTTCSPLIFHERRPPKFRYKSTGKTEIGNRKVGSMVLCYYSLIKALLELEIMYGRIQKVEVRESFLYLQ